MMRHGLLRAKGCPIIRSGHPAADPCSADIPCTDESHVTVAPRHAEQLVELRSTALVGRDHLAVENGFVYIEQSSNLVAERLETAQAVVVARDEAATARLEVIRNSASPVKATSLPRGWARQASNNHLLAELTTPGSRCLRYVLGHNVWGDPASAVVSLLG
jgi:hypothetical protein